MDSYSDPRQTAQMIKTTSTGLLAVALLLATNPVHAAGEVDVRTAQIAEEGSTVELFSSWQLPAMVYMEVSVAAGTFTLWGQLKLSEGAPEGDTRVIEARLLDGNMDAFSATWRLTPTEGGARTEVDFKIYVDPDSRENEKAAGNTLRALRTRVIETTEHS